MARLLIPYFFMCLLPQLSWSSCCERCNIIDSSGEICTECESGYKLYESKVCLEICPYGFVDEGTFCTKDDPLVINVDLSAHTKWTATTVGNFKTLNDLPFNDDSEGSPIPTKDQGFYFSNQDSRLVSVDNRPNAPDFVLSMWVYPLDYGYGIGSFNENVYPQLGIFFNEGC